MYHHERMVQVGPYYVHKDIFDGYFYPPKPEDFEPPTRSLSLRHSILALIGLVFIGIGIGLIIPV